MENASHDTLSTSPGSSGTGANGFHWTATDGLSLYGEHWAPSEAFLQPDEARISVLCLPGLSRNTRDFNEIALFLQSAGHHVYALDYRGRGGSDWDQNWSNYSIPVEAADIDTAISRLKLQRFALLGTSRGGLHALAMADRYPSDRMAAVIFNDVGPHLEMSALRRIAASIGINMKHATLESAADHLGKALGSQFPAFGGPQWLKLAGQLTKKFEGQFVLDYDPELANVFNDLDDSAPLPDVWPLYERLADRPVLIIRGEHSDLLSVETSRRMLETHAGAALKTIGGQGHAPVLWEPETHEFIGKFLSSVPR